MVEAVSKCLLFLKKGDFVTIPYRLMLIWKSVAQPVEPVDIFETRCFRAALQTHWHSLLFSTFIINSLFLFFFSVRCFSVSPLLPQLSQVLFNNTRKDGIKIFIFQVRHKKSGPTWINVVQHLHQRTEGSCWHKGIERRNKNMAFLSSSCSIFNRNIKQNALELNHRENNNRNDSHFKCSLCMKQNIKHSLSI